MSQIINLNGNGGGGGGTVSALTGNAGGAVGPTAGNINILGSGPITVTGNAGTSTLTIAMTVPLPIADGGTNATSFTTTDGTIYFDGSSLVTTSTGTAGYVLTSAGPGVAPSYQAVTASGAVTSVAGGNNITISGTATAPIVNVSGTTQHAVQIGNATGSLTSLAVGATNTVLLGNTGADPSYGTVPNAALTNSSVTLSNGNNITVTGSPLSLGGTVSFNLTGTTNHTVQVGNASGSLTSITAGTTGQVLTGVTGADPSFQSPAASSISITGNTGGALVGAAFTFTGGTTGLSFGGSGSTETLSGTLAIANGGTNATSMTNTFGVNYFDGTRLVTTTVGTAAQVLTSNGAGVAPTFQASAAASVTITGDAGTPATASAFTFTGATSGEIFTVDGVSTITSSFNYLALPATDNSGDGQISIGGVPYFQAGASGDCVFIGASNGDFTSTGSINISIGNANLNGGFGTSSANIVIGQQSMGSVTNGDGQNVSIGFQTFQSLVTGNNNIGIGTTSSGVGSAYSGAESNNFLINSNGVTGESGVIRIFSDLGDATACYIGGISGVTVVGTAVLCAANGQLGTISSSRKYKNNITDMTGTEIVHEFRPVTFTMKDDKTKHKQWGLIAEEVDEIYPDLVNYKDGKPDAVRYLDLIPMLLKEIQILRKEVDALIGLQGDR